MTSRINAFWRALLLLFCAVVALFLVAPSLVVIPLSFTDRPSFNFPPTGWSTQWYTNFFSDPSWLYALQASGMSPKNGVYEKGVAYLLRTQLEDGTWFVRSRAFGFQPYFESGFPHGTDQFISVSATAWAAIALAFVL